MTLQNSFTERRKHKRFKAKQGIFAVLSSDYNNLGRIKNISKGGLAFEFIDGGTQPDGAVELEIFSTVDDFYMKKLSVRAVPDFEINASATVEPPSEMELNLQFEEMNPIQATLLDYFIRKYTSKKI